MIKIILAEHDLASNLTVAMLVHTSPTKLERTCFARFENEVSAPIPAVGLKRDVHTVYTWSENSFRANGC
jgi:hypothetical protein